VKLAYKAAITLCSTFHCYFIALRCYDAI